jgi:large subunit ribosomal protein L18
VQAIADDLGRTLVEASTLSQELQGSLAGMKKINAAKEVGQLVSKRLQAMGIDKVIFDRGRYLYHGRVKALAEGVREAGMKL